MIALNILGEGFDGSIAISRGFLQRFQDDGFNVAFNRCVQFLRCGGSGSGHCIAKRNGRRSYRLRSQNGVLQRVSGVCFKLVGPLSGEQLIQQYPQRIDVGGDTDYLASHLFGRGVILGQGAAGQLRQIVRDEFMFADQFGNTEIEQTNLAFRGDQNVRRL